MSAPSPPAEAGGRLARRRRERDRRRCVRRRLALRGAIAVAAAAVTLAAAAATLAVLGGEPDGRGGDAGTATSGAGSGPQDTLLLVRTGTEGAAASVTLLAARGGRATAVLIPTGTLVTVPGVGMDRLGLAAQYGGPALVQASVENLLGIGVDHVAAVDEAGMARWLGRLGGVELDVPRAVTESGAEGAPVAVEAGRQTLDGHQLARYWTLSADEGGLEVLARQRQVLTAVLAEADDADARAVLTTTGDGGWPLDTDASPAWVRRLLARAAEAHREASMRMRVLPVERVGGDGSGDQPGVAYRPDADEIDQLRQQRLAASVPERSDAERVRVQVLNGVGTPGIGQDVEQRLGSGRVRLVATGNARRFDRQTTRIVIYDDSASSREAAQWVRQQLGVGTIQVSRQPQSVVDVTIVVGTDFQP